MLYENHKAFERIVKAVEAGQKVNFLPSKKFSDLSNVASANAHTLNRRKAENLKLSSIYQKIGQADRAHRVAFCCSYRYMLVDSEQRAHNVHTVRCRDRHCVECAKIKSWIYQSRLKRTAIEKIKSDFKTDEFLFLTFTVKNPKVTQMRKNMRAMSRAFGMFLQLKGMKNIFRGGIRTFEVTRNYAERLKNHCHPHIHAIAQTQQNPFDLFISLIVDEEIKAIKKEFRNKRKNADLVNKAINKVIKKYDNLTENKKNELVKVFFEKKWTNCLKKCLEKEEIEFNEEDYKKTEGRAIVDVKRVRAGGEPGAPILNGEGFQDHGEKVINYVLKYSLKEDDKRIFTGDKWSQIFDSEIKGMRMIAPFGLWRSELSKEEDHEYDEKEYFARFESVTDNNAYLAKFDSEYKAETITAAEIKRVKRSSLCLSLDYLNRRYIDTVKELKDKLNIALQKTYLSKRLEAIAINEIVVEINKYSERVRANFEKLIQYGEYVKGERFYIKTYIQAESFYNKIDLEYQKNIHLFKYDDINKKDKNWKFEVLEYLNEYRIEKIDSYQFAEIELIDVEEYAEIEVCEEAPF
ncbi:protein rep [Klebsiella pneumoniae]|uniref:protein rep n=6 Tax=Klebsiella pneumoniae TaxID=573 RepID=UPI000E2CD012|nr:protein rep [Klebsiella pneumoniae]SVM07254.1 Replication protein [Klebsiella pneumoniae]SVM11318.1 Replication protein [Klebsiella pneumoniae]SVM27068.1 Replication protein [Klebsiella pneumoniae]SVM48772.1 Replication protein [Klebsiella pneumoniae]SVM57555.1 Replication protein [Klebsiella pneumoniae]